MSVALNLAPRVVLYTAGNSPAPVLAPLVEEGRVALQQLPPAPGAAPVFGDGSHPTTRLCATAVDLLCRQRQPSPPAVLDVGTGTGILARIARARGARLVVATDIDAAALSCAKAHAELDRHPVEIELSHEAPDYWGARFDLVVANILQEPLEALAPAICSALAVGGVLLISGFTRPQAPSLRVLYERVGVTLLGQSNLEDWVLLTFASPR